jgi:amidohydrolase
VRELLRRRVEATLERTAAAMGCRLEFELHPGYPAVVNDSGAVEIVRRVAGEVFGAENVHEPPPMATAEDFAHFLRHRPGAFVFLGAGNRERGIDAAHHTPRFDFDESVLARGAELLARLALEE